MSPKDDDNLRVMRAQQRQAEGLDAAQAEQRRATEQAIFSVEAFLRERGVALPETVRLEEAVASPKLRPWQEIVEEAHSTNPTPVSIADLLTADEIGSVISEHYALESEFKASHELDTFDWTIAGVAGVLGALIDIFLVQLPKHPGFLGGKESEGGWLSNAVKERIGRVLPDDKIRSLENEYRVSYDASTSRGLDQAVWGLGPGTHRFQSLGHDPVLGWIFGVRDLLKGEFTALGKDGQWIVQATGDPLRPGEHFYLRLFAPLRIVAGHMLSDVATSRGLPAPLMPLLLFLQKGTIGKQGYNVGEVARQMYAMGYDFRHFLASSLPVSIIEGIVRVAFFVKAISEGKSLSDAVPLANAPKLRTQLFVAHSVATAANAGKVYVTQSPLAVNWPQWLAFFRYLLPQLHWLLVGYERERARYVEAHVDEVWRKIEAENALLWRRIFGDTDQAVL